MNCQFSIFELLCHYHSITEIYNFYGGELTVHANSETLGDIIKYYREKSDYTVEELANKIGITERYLYRIENEGKKPSYDILYKIIRILKISPEIIFFPDMISNSSNMIRIIHMLSLCDEKNLNKIEKIISILVNQYNSTN